MPRMKIALACAVALAPLALAPAASADGGFMNQDEWNAVLEGQTKQKVENNCACTGAWNGNTTTHNGNDYKQRMFRTHVGEAFIWFRLGADGNYHVGYNESWCPGDTLGVPDGNCTTQVFG